jgi:hypothetical protein
MRLPKSNSAASLAVIDELRALIRGRIIATDRGASAPRLGATHKRTVCAASKWDPSDDSKHSISTNPPIRSFSDIGLTTSTWPTFEAQHYKCQRQMSEAHSQPDTKATYGKPLLCAFNAGLRSDRRFVRLSSRAKRTKVIPHRFKANFLMSLKWSRVCHAAAPAIFGLAKNSGANPAKARHSPISAFSSR